MLVIVLIIIVIIIIINIINIIIIIIVIIITVIIFITVSSIIIAQVSVEKGRKMVSNLIDRFNRIAPPIFNAITLSVEVNKVKLNFLLVVGVM